MNKKNIEIYGARFLHEFHEIGIIHSNFKIKDFEQENNPRAYIEYIIGFTSQFIRVENLDFKKISIPSENDDVVEFTTTASTYFPPNLQIYSIPKNSNSKLNLQLLDSWMLLQEAENRSAEFYHNLFNRIRVMRYEKAAFIAPTFSTINGRLIFAQPPKLGAKDKLGERVKNWVSNREPIEIELSAGEMLIIDNHRYAKKIGESSILDDVESYSVWTEQVTNHPNEKHLALAKAFKIKLGEVFPMDAEKMMMRFGLLDKPLDDYIRAFLDTPTRLDELMPIYKQVFNELYAA